MKRNLYAALAILAATASVFGFRQEAFGKRHCYTLEAFRYRQATLFGIPIYRTTTQHEPGFVSEYKVLFDDAPDERHWHIGRPDWVRTILMERAPGYGMRWETRQRHEILRQIYERFRVSGSVEDTKAALRALDSLIPPLENIDGLKFEDLDSLRVSLGLPPALTQK